MPLKQKIFLVDDEPEDIFLVHKMLKKQGFQHVACCEGGRYFPNLLPFANIDVVISDFAMSSIGGTEILSKLKKHKESAKAKVIFYSEHDINFSHERAGVQCVFTRRIDFVKLTQVLLGFQQERASSEKRLFKRFKKHPVLAVDPDTNAIDSVVDVSLSGIGFHSKYAFDLNHQLKVGVRAWNEKKYSFREGVIVRKDPEKTGMRYGLQFEKPVIAPLAA